MVFFVKIKKIFVSQKARWMRVERIFGKGVKKGSKERVEEVIGKGVEVDFEKGVEKLSV